MVPRKRRKAALPQKPGSKYPGWDPTDPAAPGKEPASLAIPTPFPLPGGTMPAATPVPTPITEAASGMWLGTCKANGDAGVNAYLQPYEGSVVGETMPSGAALAVIEQGEQWHKVLIGIKQLYVKARMWTWAASCPRGRRCRKQNCCMQACPPRAAA